MEDPIVQIKEINYSIGNSNLLSNGNANFHYGDKVVLLGRNGEGKTTLLKIIFGSILPHEGQISFLPGLKLAYLNQSTEPDESFQVYPSQSIEKYLHDFLDKAIKIYSGESFLTKRRPQRGHPWKEVEALLLKEGISPSSEFRALSGGWKRRLLFTLCLASNPDLIILDEPTNHMDMNTILWMENALSQFHGTVLFVSHDRKFLSKVATRVYEIDRGAIYDWECNYKSYLKKKEKQGEEEEAFWTKFGKKLREEEVWIRQGIKARRTRNEGRVRQLEKMREQNQNRQLKKGQVKFSLNEGNITGKKVFNIDKLSLSFGHDSLFHDLSFQVFRGDRIGILGNNGTGKTSFLKLLSKELSPDSGVVTHGTNLQIAYFDQHRLNLDPKRSLRENLTETDYVSFNNRNVHVYQYLKNFLFTPDRANNPTWILSGGEKNRLLLAKLFLIPSNVLILDEPTNDLDCETLELLEEIIHQYEGTVLVVSHDREFLENISTSYLFFKNKGEVIPYIGHLDSLLSEKDKNHSSPPKKTLSQKNKSKCRKLTYKERLELEALPDQIESCEEKLETLQNKCGDQNLYKTSPHKIKDLQKEMSEKSIALDSLYQRWEALLAIQSAYEKESQ